MAKQIRIGANAQQNQGGVFKLTDTVVRYDYRIKCAKGSLSEFVSRFCELEDPIFVVPLNVQFLHVLEDGQMVVDVSILVDLTKLSRYNNTYGRSFSISLMNETLVTSAMRTEQKLVRSPFISKDELFIIEQLFTARAIEVQAQADATFAELYSQKNDENKEGNTDDKKSDIANGA